MFTPSLINPPWTYVVAFLTNQGKLLKNGNIHVYVAEMDKKAVVSLQDWQLVGMSHMHRILGPVMKMAQYFLMLALHRHISHTHLKQCSLYSNRAQIHK